MAACNQSWVDCSGFSCIGAALKTAAACSGQLAKTIVAGPAEKLRSECKAFAQSYTDNELYAQPFTFEPTGWTAGSLAAAAQTTPGKMPTPDEMRAYLAQLCSNKDWTGQALVGWAKKKAPEALAGAGLAALGSDKMDELLSYLPGPVKDVAMCLVDKAGADAYVAAAEAAAGDVDKAAKRLAPYAAGCGLLEVADQLGTGLFSDILRKIAGQLTAAPKPAKTKVATGHGLKDVCYYHYPKGGGAKEWRCPGDPGYVSVNSIPLEVVKQAVEAPAVAQDLLTMQQGLFGGSYGATSQQPAMLPLLLLGALVWAVA